MVEEDPNGESGNRRQQAARKRAQRERMERAEAAAEQLRNMQKADARVSISEAEARWMKHGDHAIVPSYNLQVSTDADSGVIVGVELSQSAEDSHELPEAMKTIEENLNRKPEQVVADGGFTNRATIEEMAAGGIDFYGSIKDPKERSEAAMKSHGIDPKFAPHFFILQPETRTAQCPAGKQLKYLRRSTKRGDEYVSYRADGADCLACGFQKQCCPNNPAKGRIWRIGSRAGRGGGRPVPKEDGQRRRASHLSTTRCGGGVPLCVPQRTNETPQVPFIRYGQSRHGGPVGQPGVQRHDLDSTGEGRSLPHPLSWPPNADHGRILRLAYPSGPSKRTRVLADSEAPQIPITPGLPIGRQNQAALPAHRP